MEFDSFLELCKSRRSIRAFSDSPVPAEAIDKIRAAAATAPYASGKGRFEILALTDRKLICSLEELVLKRVGELKREIREDLRDGFEAYASNFTGFTSAPLLLIPTFRVTPALSLMAARTGFDAARWERDNYVKSISCVCMILLLAARSLGFGSCYMTGPLIASEAIARAAGARPGHEVGALIPVGYPAKEETVEKA